MPLSDLTYEYLTLYEHKILVTDNHSLLVRFVTGVPVMLKQETIHLRYVERNSDQ
jgi:hypothetical protein